MMMMTMMMMMVVVEAPKENTCVWTELSVTHTVHFFSVGGSGWLCACDLAETTQRWGVCHEPRFQSWWKGRGRGRGCGGGLHTARPLAGVDSCEVKLQPQASHAQS